MESIKQIIDKTIDKNIEDVWKLSKIIHANPEMAFNEIKACEIQCNFLEKLGFKVKKGLGSLPTAFEASIGNGTPVVAILSEYDALEIGHACGHNLIATSAMNAAIGTKAVFDKHELNGTIRIIGTPAEESGGGKIIQLNEGVYDDVDAVILMHPTSFTTRLAGECLSSKRFKIKYLGKSAHASSHPSNGINALSAANLFLVATGMLRQSFKADARLSCIIVNGGKQTGLIPEEAEIAGSLACFNLNDLNKYHEMIENAAKGCATAMGCGIEFEIIDGYQGRIPNKILSDVCKKELEELNEPLMEGMPIDYGGEDLGNISRVVPICNPYVTIFPEYKISNHTHQFKELSISDAGKRCINIAGKAMARTAVELILNPNIILKAKEELKDRIDKE